MSEWYSSCGVTVRVNESSSGRKYESRHICIKIYIVEMRESDCDKKVHQLVRLQHNIHLYIFFFRIYCDWKWLKTKIFTHNIF